MVAAFPSPSRGCNVSIGERVLARQAELEDQLVGLTAGSPDYTAIDTALATLHQYLGADLEHLGAPTARDLAGWLERTRYLGRSAA